MPSGLLSPFSGLSGRSAAQEGIAVHIVNEVAESVVLPGPSQADGSQPVHRHLGHSSEDMLTANTDTTPEFVRRLLFFAERVAPPGFEQNEVLAIFGVQVSLACLGLISTVGKDRLVVFIDQFFEHLTVVHVRRGRGVAADQFIMLNKSLSFFGSRYLMIETYQHGQRCKD